MRNEDGFVRALMNLISLNEADVSLRVMAVACLNDNVKNFYREREGDIISKNDKTYLKQNIINAITSHLHIPQIRYPTPYQPNIPRNHECGNGGRLSRRLAQSSN